MHISNFQQTNISFEMRYTPAFPLYDESGAIWEQAEKKWPGIKPIEAMPNTSRFVVKGEAELGIGLEKAHVIWPIRAFEQERFIEYAQFVTNNVRSVLRVAKFTRIGLRQIFLKRAKTIEEASEIALSAGLLHVPEGRMFGVDGLLKGVEFSFRYEDEALGWLAKISSRRKKVIFEPPLGEEDLPAREEEFFEVIFDVDYYTVAPVSVGKFKADNWIEQAQRLLRRDSKAILGE